MTAKPGENRETRDDLVEVPLSDEELDTVNGAWEGQVGESGQDTLLRIEHRMRNVINSYI
ncbi:hypothetical protein [Spongiactinospora sp. TRM90649]|uniref:hypothetical protein n=1 Tax=Spongiactinospora sp. TRM90649 TaxID=3031114 RepID=UPI0023F98487|nr:hypothetical protein [Spongiactinospora sp. TRM90649]MDF5757700.1 hypothetical protein [Spongiactinospora sp. TRM90649]